jgi:dTDP-4-amino-4,6-dideoxygalactose transaminase
VKQKSSKNKDAFSDPSIKVPFFIPQITREDKISMNKALDAPMLTDGPRLREFESLFAKFTGAKYAVGVSNATSALHLSLKAAGISKGDEVIIPDLTFVATANAVLLCDATPVLADVNDDLNISVGSIKKSLTSRTKAILPVHMAGKAADMHIITKIARSNGLVLIEDCAHAIGARIGAKHVGTFGDAGCFSFYPTKNITTIEGGMVITNSRSIARYVMTARSHGITRTLSQRYAVGKPWDYDVIEPGYNYRLDEIRSTLGISQLKRIKDLNLARRRACEYYNSKLAKIKGVITPKITQKNDNAFHLYIIRIQKEYGLSRDELFKKLLKFGIRTSVHYKPLHEFTAYKKKGKTLTQLTNVKKIYREMISLPLYPHITKHEQDLVIECIVSNYSK